MWVDEDFRLTSRFEGKDAVQVVALSRVLNGSAGISADMDLRLSKALSTTPGSSYAMQANYDVSRAKRRCRAKVQRIATPSRETGPAEAPG